MKRIATEPGKQKLPNTGLDKVQAGPAFPSDDKGMHFFLHDVND